MIRRRRRTLSLSDAKLGSDASDGSFDTHLRDGSFDTHLLAIMSVCVDASFSRAIAWTISHCMR